MDETQIVSALAALAHQHRLRIFRLLVRAGPSGVPAGEIAEQVGISPKELDHAGLVTSTRDGRFVRYAVRVEGMRQLLRYLTEDCCRGQPELCGADIKKARAVCTREKA